MSPFPSRWFSRRSDPTSRAGSVISAAKSMDLSRGHVTHKERRVDEARGAWWSSVFVSCAEKRATRAGQQNAIGMKGKQLAALDKL